MGVARPVDIGVGIDKPNDVPAADDDTLTVPGHQPTAIGVATLLANDDPGPSNEAAQTLGITAVGATAQTHGTVALNGGTVTYIPDNGHAGAARRSPSAPQPGETATIRALPLLTRLRSRRTDTGRARSMVTTAISVVCAEPFETTYIRSASRAATIRSRKEPSAWTATTGFGRSTR